MWDDRQREKKFVIKIRITFDRIRKILRRLARAVGGKVE
jgi:hypothetical protein